MTLYFGEDVERPELLDVLSGNVKWCDRLMKQF